MSTALVTLGLLVLPTLGPRIYSLFTRRAPTANETQPPTAKTPLMRALSSLVMVHSLYILFSLLFLYPTNIFTSLRTPLTTTTPALRQILLSYKPTPDDTLPPQLETLLTRLQSFDARDSYVRYGHDAVADCDWCVSSSDFALFAIPSAALQYIRTAALLGVMTMVGSGKSKWRLWAVALIAVAAAAEGYFLMTVTVQSSPRVATEQTVMWHDRTWTLRQLLFLVLPIIIHLLPYSYHHLSPLITLPPALQTLDRAVASLRVLDTVRSASLRHDGLRREVVRYWEDESRRAERGRVNEEVIEEAGKVGMGYVQNNDGEPPKEGEDEAPLLQSVQASLKSWSELILGPAWTAVRTAIPPGVGDELDPST